MQVCCPNCGAKVSADNINIQRMTAVCAACDTVFSFDLPEIKPKTKWRDVSQPEKMVLRDADTLRMDFATNFRLDRNANFFMGTAGGIGASVIALMLGADPEVPGLLTLSILVIAAFLFYWSVLTVLNKTHIEMDEDLIAVERKPFPNPFEQKLEILLDGVTGFKYEETAISKKEAYDTPRYRVLAETTDGISRTIVTDVIEDYAVFIAQTLEERLYGGLRPELPHLEDDENQPDAADAYEVLRQSQKQNRS
jgi:transcription initiation factor TFIIIB Brf1 subunit/transcription initiation factor TFIIB